MNSFDFDFCEIGRSVDVLSDRVIKTIKFLGEIQKIESALAEVKQVFEGIENLRQITTVKSLEVGGTNLTIHQERVHLRKPTDTSTFMPFINEVMKANRFGWVFGDINYKNVIFDGMRFRMIDFEPFTKILKSEGVEYRVTPPYFHPLDQRSNHVTSLTDRLGLIGLYVRLSFGQRKQKEIFSLHASILHEIACTEGNLFIKNLQDLDKTYA